MKNIGIEEIIKILTKVLKENETNLQSGRSSAGERALSKVLEVALRELDFRVEKVADVIGDSVADDGGLLYDTYICPKCKEHYEIDYHNYNYCPNCGQKLRLNFEESENED